jgi:hypothetical protein
MQLCVIKREQKLEASESNPNWNKAIGLPDGKAQQTLMCSLSNP